MIIASCWTPRPEFHPSTLYYRPALEATAVPIGNQFHAMKDVGRSENLDPPSAQSHVKYSPVIAERLSALAMSSEPT